MRKSPKRNQAPAFKAKIAMDTDTPREGDHTHLKDILRPYRMIIVIFILIAFFIRIPILHTRGYDPDEFQHLHSARQIYHGEIPYRDYFDHHTPFLHLILSTLYPTIGENVKILDAARNLMLIFTAAIFLLTFILARKLYNIDIGLLAVLFLSYVLMFLEKTIEVRPDSGAVVFWLGAMVLMIKGVQSKTPAKLFAFSGIAMGIALMFTQKILFGLPGIFLALVYPFLDNRAGIGRKQNVKLIFFFALGIVLPILLTCFFFLIQGALWDFMNCNFLINSQWKGKLSPIVYMTQLTKQNPFYVVLGLAGLLATIACLRRREEIAKGVYIPFLCTISVISGLFIIPVPERQYYLLFLPMLAIYAAYIIHKVADFDIEEIKLGILAKKWTAFHFIFLPAVVVLITGGLIFALSISKPSLDNLADILKFTHLKPSILYVFLCIVFTISAVTMFRLKKTNYAVMLIAICIIVHPLDQMINYFSQRNDWQNWQIFNIEYILQNTSSSDAVLDGWSGLGFLRPHAYYYYFLHGEMQAMLSEKELTDDLIKSTEDHHTKIVIFDRSLRALPNRTKAYITSHYQPTGIGNLYIRNSNYIPVK